jgi:hypothetical protein
MKFVQLFASFAIVAVVLSVSAFAKDTHSGKFTLTDPVQVGSTQLAPGDYKVEWNGPASDVKVNIMQNGRSVATVDGRIQDLQKPAAYNAVHTKTLQNDTKALDEIEFGNRTEVLVLGGE